MKGNLLLLSVRRKKRIMLNCFALPPHWSEVSIGAFPKDASEEELMELCSEIGKIVKGKHYPWNCVDHSGLKIQGQDGCLFEAAFFW
ncbi:putative nucleotide-binding alpha-beta plait domain-containing protein [Rosa chinensis]|uniref:Putative nucleotide-binding alpha-beta plait domain-containing protein n=1 Tax=Rosa chinensis TaxID=74649 RepID=A0A2P6Q2K7_ROSCH|nr:putative nucleotide-binding alpha-beta plait domain-containing protein [Rosa chinensis]